MCVCVCVFRCVPDVFHSNIVKINNFFFCCMFANLLFRIRVHYRCEIAMEIDHTFRAKNLERIFLEKSA